MKYDGNHCRLGDLMTLEYGFSLPANSRRDGIYPVVGSGGITGNHDEFAVEGPCVVVGRKGSIGEVYWINENCTPIDTTFFVHPIGDVSLKYLYYLLTFLPLQNMVIQVGTPGLRRKEVYDQIVPRITLDEQERITAILDTANETLDIQRSKVSKLELIREGLLHDLMKFGVDDNGALRPNPLIQNSVPNEVEEEE